MTALRDILAQMRPGAQWALTGDTLDDLTWLDQTQTVPTQAEIDAWTGPVPTADDYASAIQAMIDGTAQAKQYTDGNSCATYALADSPPGTNWKNEALAFLEWRGNVWAYAFQQMALVQSGQRAQPSVADMVAEIETAFPMTWPMSA
jgi:hypothetical protein